MCLSLYACFSLYMSYEYICASMCVRGCVGASPSPSNSGLSEPPLVSHLPLRGRQEVCGQLSGQLMALKFDLDEVVGQRELLVIQ